MDGLPQKYRAEVLGPRTAFAGHAVLVASSALSGRGRKAARPRPAMDGPTGAGARVERIPGARNGARAPGIPYQGRRTDSEVRRAPGAASSGTARAT